MTSCFCYLTAIAIGGILYRRNNKLIAALQYATKQQTINTSAFTKFA